MYGFAIGSFTIYYFDIKKVPICLNFLKKGLGLEAHVAFVNR